MSSMLELLNGGVGWGESVLHKEDEVHEGPELDCSVVAGALGVFARSEVEVESQSDQVGNLMGFGIAGEGFCGDNGVDNAKWDAIFLFNWWVLQAVGFKLSGETSI